VMRVFAKELKDRTRLSAVKLSGVENGDIRWFNKSYTRNLLKYPEVRDCIDAVDLHSYFLYQPLPFFNDRIKFLKRYRKWMDKHYPDMPIKMSEWTHMVGGKNPHMDSALETVKVMIEDFTLLGVTSWQHWIACSHYDYHDGLIYLDIENKSFETTKRLYATGNFSKYIPLGARRVEVNCDDDDIMLVAFENEEKTVLVIVNPTKKEKNYTLSRDAIMAVTNNEKNLEESTARANESIEITSESVTTVVLKK
ncbi:MAG: hypothetical protein IKL47_04835, partial [Clostridia bacterium]|nr:hypothetical protein [Clostridia bacterium]